ncbi:MAG: ABC transporter ATP-binding protein [Methanobacteriota archaeon]|nr:MAG: ABC transporter ATP-binding protein [Euryarchaeota archaeon]
MNGKELREVANPILKVKNLQGGYGKVQIIYDISLTMDKQEIVTIIGPNGCGKSTFLKIIYGLASYYSGYVEYAQTPIMKKRTDLLVRWGISYVPQVNNVFPDLTIEENLEMGFYLSDGNLEDAIDYVFSIFPDLKPRRFEFASNLSGGQRQMLALGRALMTGPTLLLLDEPTAALSPTYVETILRKIKELREEGVSILLVEQNAKSALAHSDYGYVFASGRVVHHDDAQAILKDPQLGEKFLGFAH